MSEDNETYCSTGGIQLEGNDFQIKLLELFLKRGLDKGYDFKLATEWDEADKFDDLIFMYKNNEDEWVHRFLQAKHRKDTSKKITVESLTADSGDFSLQKYFVSYQKIVRNPRFTRDNVHIKDFIICTNTDFDNNIDIKQNFKKVEDDFFTFCRSTEKRAKLLQLKRHAPFVKDIIIPTLKKSSDITRLAVEIASCVDKNKFLDIRKDVIKTYQTVLVQYVINLDTSITKGKTKITKFQGKFLDGTHKDIQNFRDELYKAFTRITNVDKSTFWNTFMIEKTLQISQEFGKTSSGGTLTDLNNSVVTNEDIHNFFDKLVFAVNLPNEDELGKIIASTLHKDHNDIKEDVIEPRFKAYIEEWVKSTKKNFLTQIDGNNFISELARLEIDSYTAEYCAKIEKQTFSFKDGFVELSEFLKSNKQIFNIITELDTMLGLSKILSACKLDNLLVRPICISLKLAFDKKEKLVQAFSSTEKNHTLIIDCKTAHDSAKLFYQNLLKIVQGNKTKKIILVTRKEKNILGINDINNIFGNDVTENYEFNCNFNDLSDSSQKKILEKNILFQAKEVALGSIVDKDLVDGEALSKLINDEKIEIGERLEDLDVVENYYIDRTFTRHIIFPKSIIKQSIQFYITENSQINVKSIKNEQDIVIISDTDGYFLDIRKHYDKRNIHWFKNEDNKLIWQQSHGNFAKLQNIQPEPIKITNINKLTDINDKIVIVAAQAGMGKSTILTYLAKNTINIGSNSVMWIARINLNNYTNFLDQCNFQNINMVLDFLFNVINSDFELEKKLFTRNLTEKGNVALLFDGFDEISPYYKKKVIQLLHIILNETKVEKLWITTRLHLKQELENEFNTLSYKLKQFSRDDQRTFLRKYWGQSGYYLPNKVDSYIDKLLDVMSTSIKDMTFELVSIPLQTRMLAEAYEDNFNTYLESNIMPQFNETFDLIDLYECFINKKFKIFFEDKMKANLSNQAAKESLLDNQKLIKNQHKLLAINTLYPGKLNNALFDNGYPNEQLLRVGLINKLDNNRAQFIHRTFAEYFIALWLSDTDNLINADVQALLIAVLGTYKRYGNEVILNFLNKILIGKIEIHTAVINRDEDKVRSLLQTNKNTINSTDKANRTVLHLAVIYGYEDIIKVLLEHNANVNCYDKGFNWSPLVYAAQMESWDIAKLLIDKGACSQDLQKVRIDLQEKEYNQFENKETLLHFSISYADIDTIKCITKKCTYVNNKDNDGNTPLHLAAQHGYDDVVVALLQNGAIYNLKNNYSKTPLKVSKSCKKIKQNINLIKKLFRLLPKILTKPVKRRAECFKFLKIKRKKVKNPSEIKIMFLLTKLLQKRVITQARNENGENSLHYAAKGGYYDVVETLITHVRNHNPDTLIQYVNTEDKEGYTALHYAVRCGKADIVRYLLDNNADVNTKNRDYMSPLDYAAKHGHWDVVQTLITHVRNHHPDILIQYVNTQNKEGDTALHYAVRCDKADIVRYLLDNSADVNTKDIDNMTTLHEAVLRGYCDVVQTLITHVRNHHPDILTQYVNTEDKDGNTPLYYAVMYVKADIIRYLLDNNADVNTKDICDMTPLHAAAERGHYDIVETLITHVRNHHPDTLIQYVNTENKDGNTPLYCAARKGKVDIVRYLLDNNADVNTKGRYNRTPLHVAAKGGRYDVVQTLITHVRNHHPDILIQYINTEDEEGNTALYYAAMCGKVDIIRDLLDNNADVNTKDIRDITPLHVAAEGGHYDVVEILITHVRNHHPDILIQYVNTQNKDGNTALDLIFNPIQYYPWEEIKFNGHVVKLLINEGAYFNKEELLSNTEIKFLRRIDPALYQDIIDAINNRTSSNPNIS